MLVFRKQLVDCSKQLLRKYRTLPTENNYCKYWSNWNLFSTMSEVRTTISSKIGSKKVFIISKSYCPFCTKAKKVFQDEYLSSGILKPDQYEVMEIENDPNCEEIQELMAEMTGARSVPRVFINGNCIGGGDETVQLHAQGKLKDLL